MGVVGRTPADFFKNWNDFLEYKSQEYPLYVHNTFIVREEDNESMILEYATTYEEMTCFCLGMIEFILCEQYHVAKQNLQILAEPETCEQRLGDKENYFKTLFKVKFDNRWFKNSPQERGLTLTSNGVHASTLKTSKILKLFPFFLHFDRNLKILHAGITLRRAIQNIVGSSLDELFSLKQPSNGILAYPYIIGNLHMTYIIRMKNCTAPGNEAETTLMFQGQMMEAIPGTTMLFLGNPTAGCFLGSTNTFYIGDLAPGYYKQTVISMMCLKNSLIEHCLDLEKENTKYRKNCAETVFKETTLTNTLLNQLMPPHIHKAVRVGRPYGDTCEVHSEVSILLSDMVGFTKICSQISPMEVAMMLNSMYMVFDSLLSTRSSFYKAETIGDGYMVVVGIPNKEEKHAEHAAELAIAMVSGLKNINLPFLENQVTVKMGIHSGPIVAGVIGWKVPRYSVFGDSVNVVNALESTSKPNRIHISDNTFKLLDKTGLYLMKDRRRNSIIESKISKKLKDIITKTYWLCGKGTIYMYDTENPNDAPAKDAVVLVETKDKVVEAASPEVLPKESPKKNSGSGTSRKEQLLENASNVCRVQ